ncbi:hypothetical protein sscle_07g060310 [Sclerotinia sclerotiorum 1980 UF-70]|nr:hypothetical protein sscle_07g060310 [Sclerotinia sclerotiorum 1980 UF-70]
MLDIDLAAAHREDMVVADSNTHFLVPVVVALKKEDMDGDGDEYGRVESRESLNEVVVKNTKMRNIEHESEENEKMGTHIPLDEFES